MTIYLDRNNGKNILWLASRYDKRKKHPDTGLYRFMTVQEAKALCSGDHAPFLTLSDLVAEVKINGKPKTWKRDPERVEVPVKYGLYEYDKDKNIGRRMSTLLVQLDNAFIA